ncbi:DUF4190 domain-containing protein [Streptomyces sp. NPDC047022]|uniref:DUF4190 domain-containing protein n=1 Tax=Streptomyces sp. NPDC047022 TaxID=3155737 RepID=UPI0033F2E409
MPYQTWGQGYSPYNRPAPVNGLAITALVLGILCCLPGVGLVLGLIALRQIKRRGEQGHGLAVGGMVLSMLGLFVWVLALASGAAHDFWDGVRSGAQKARAVSATYSVRKGECFDSLDGSLTGEMHGIRKVPCSGEHQAEVFAYFALPGGVYPGNPEVREEAEGRCNALRSAYAMDSWAVPDDVHVYYIRPDGQAWSRGEHHVICMFGGTGDQATLTGTLRRDATDLTADEAAYLRADGVLYTALGSAPTHVRSAGDDLPSCKAWAARVATALDVQTRQLHARTWGNGAGPSVEGQVKALEQAREEWSEAARAADVHTFYAHYDRGTALLEGRAAVTARKALGLATTPPSHATEGEGIGNPDENPGKQV